MPSFRYTQHDDVAVGSLIANRNQIEIERLIGMFANTIVLRTDLSGDPTFSEVLRRVRQVNFDAYRNQDLPIEEILQALQVSAQHGSEHLVSGDVHSAKAVAESSEPSTDCPCALWTWTLVSRGST